MVFVGWFRIGYIGKNELVDKWKMQDPEHLAAFAAAVYRMS